MRKRGADRRGTPVRELDGLDCCSSVGAVQSDYAVAGPVNLCEQGGGRR
jgi:hypothetical protein